MGSAKGHLGTGRTQEGGSLTPPGLRSRAPATRQVLEQNTLSLEDGDGHESQWPRPGVTKRASQTGTGSLCSGRSLALRSAAQGCADQAWGQPANVESEVTGGVPWRPSG